MQVLALTPEEQVEAATEPTLTPPEPERIVMLDGLLDNVVYCTNCGGIYPRDLMSAHRAYDGKIICGICRQTDYVSCGRCGVAHLPSDGTAVTQSYRGNNTSYCPTCTAEMLTCTGCGDIQHDTWSIANTSDGRLCRDCIEALRLDSCSCCGLWVMPETLEYDEHDNGRCASCAENSVVCSGCGEWTDVDEATQRGALCYCDDCYDEISATIHRYDYRPAWRKLSLGSEKNPNLFLGLEIETESDVYDKTAQAEDVIAASEGAAYAKEDGSLDDGIEFCLHPCTAEYLLTDSLLPRICAAARDAGLRSHDTDTCGLHIHVSKAGLAKTRKGQDYVGAKLVTMVDAHWGFFWTFSRRDGERWCKKANVDVKRTDAPDDVRNKTNKCRHDRYYAVNLCPHNTVELRLWRGTLNIKTLQSTVLLTRAMVDVARGYSASAIVSMDTVALREKLLAKAKLYGSDEQVKNLINYMESRGV